MAFVDAEPRSAQPSHAADKATIHSGTTLLVTVQLADFTFISWVRCAIRCKDMYIFSCVFLRYFFGSRVIGACFVVVTCQIMVMR